jgi:hypothetical protein
MTLISREWETWLGLAATILVCIVAFLRVHMLLVQVALVATLALAVVGSATLVLADRQKAEAGVRPTRRPRRPALRAAFVTLEILIVIGAIKYLAR